jgi:diguanylate cyclase (GGDEF)-like protein/PAS domain S-box-containing protein
MNLNVFLSSVSLVSVFIYLFIGIFTLRHNPNSKINRIFMILCTSYAIWSFAYSLAYIAENNYVFSFWNKISAIGWCNFSGITLYLVLIITENRIMNNRIVKVLLFLPGIIFLYMAVFLFGEGIKTPAIISNIFYTGDFLYNFIFLFTSILFIFLWGYKSNSTRIKSQARIIVISSITPFVLNLLTQTLLPSIWGIRFPNIGQIYSVMMIIGTYFVIVNYKFLRLPEEYIFEEVINEMLDMVIIIDEKGHIIKITNHTLDMLKYKENELIKQDIKMIIDESYIDVISVDEMTKSNKKYFDIGLLTKAGERLPVNISCKQILDEKIHDLLGIVLIIQDISLVYELRKKNEELKDFVYELTRAEEKLRIQYNENLEKDRMLSISEEKFRTIYEQAPLGITLCDTLTGKFVEVNEKFTKITGRTTEELINTGWRNITHPDDIKENLSLNLLLTNRTIENFSLNKRYIKPDGTTVWANIIIVPLKLGDMAKPIEFCMVEDITDRHMMENQIFNEKELYKTTLYSVGDGVISTDKEGNIKLINKMGEVLTGYTLSEAQGKPLEEIFNLVDEVSRIRCENPVKQVLNTGKIMTSNTNKLLISKDGLERPVEYTSAPILSEDGNLIGAVLVYRDFSERKEKQKQIEYLSYRDQLTGLFNRRYFEEELRLKDVERNLPLTLIMADVNGLKLINDSFGHAKGDELLKKVADIMSLGCRADDVIARLGGDEFVIILPKTDSNEAEQIIQRIKTMASQERIGSIDISVSYGCETKNMEAEKIYDILKKSEDNMYKKKLFESPSMRGKTIKTIISTLHEKNKREEQHSKRVSELCKYFGEALNLPQDEVDELRTIGLLHDIGKIAIEDSILNKPGKLTKEEFDEIKRHPEIGYRILSTVNDMSEMAEFVLAHHERWDGHGYPKGIKGDEIPIVSRIITIADSYDAMTSERSYREALSEEMAIDELKSNAGRQFDPELVKIFIDKVWIKISNQLIITK